MPRRGPSHDRGLLASRAAGAAAVEPLRSIPSTAHPPWAYDVALWVAVALHEPREDRVRLRNHAKLPDAVIPLGLPKGRLNCLMPSPKEEC